MNKISFFIEKIETKYSIRFKPTKEFYKRVGIGQRRFKMLYRNEVTPNLDELIKLAEYFGLKNYVELYEETKN
jgi:hypothetical protein